MRLVYFHQIGGYLVHHEWVVVAGNFEIKQRLSVAGESMLTVENPPEKMYPVVFHLRSCGIFFAIENAHFRLICLFSPR